MRNASAPGVVQELQQPGFYLLHADEVAYLVLDSAINEGGTFRPHDLAPVVVHDFVPGMASHEMFEAQ